VVQTHASFANTTECYAKGVIGYTERDVTVSVPKLYFGYATGSNLLFPFAVGATTVLFPEAATPELVFERIARFRPTILINVPTMINHMVSHPAAASQDLSCLRLATSAGEPLPVELYQRWKRTFGVELLDGLGTAEMWHIFISNRPGQVRPGTLGTVVPGFDVKVCDDEGRELPAGEVGVLWVRGGSRALGYWQQMEKTKEGFRGEWYVSGDMVRRDPDGYFTYCGRADDLLKVSRSSRRSCGSGSSPTSTRARSSFSTRSRGRISARWIVRGCAASPSSLAASAGGTAARASR